MHQIEAYFYSRGEIPALGLRLAGLKVEGCALALGLG